MREFHSFFFEFSLRAGASAMPRGSILQSFGVPLQSDRTRCRCERRYYLTLDFHSPTMPALFRSPGSEAPGLRRARACASCRRASWDCNRGRAKGPRIPGWVSAGRAASRHPTRPERGSGCRSWDSGWSGTRRQFLLTATESSHLEGCRL